ERTLARGRGPHDVVPDVAIFELQRITLDPDVRGERRGEKTLRVGELHGRAGRVAAGAIDFDRACFQLEAGGGFGQRLAFRARVLDLVIDVENLGFGARGGELLFELSRHLLERTHLLRLDFEGLHQYGAETALHRRADLTFLERKGGIGYRSVDHRRFGDGTEVD